MTSSISKAQKGLVSQLIKLRKLTQPYFLPYTKNNGWLFVYLLIALLFCVGGTVLFLLTGLMSLLTNLAPEVTNQFLGGVQNSLKVIWNGPSGIIISSLFALGIFSFITVRGQLRQRRWLPWLLLGVIILMLLSVNGINAGITFLVRDITNALIQKDESESYKNLWILGICFIAALPIRSFQFYFSAKLQLLWREWLSKSLITDYLDDRTYYILNPNDESETNVDNPDQRITEDARDFTAQTIDLSLNIFDSLLVFSLNIFILLSISKELTLALIVYATLVSSLLLFASRKLFKLNYDQLRFEADFRYGLVHVRNNAESIAFYSGENQEEKEVSRRLKSVVDNFNLLIIWEALLRVLQRSGIYGSVFIPFIILAGPILSGQMDYGSFQQANLNYNLLEGSLFFIIYKIEALARFSASIGRLEGFQSNMNEIRNNQFDDFKVEIKTNDSIILKNVSIKTPGKDNYLINNLNLSLETGQSLLVVGPSGCGKTSLLRAISGLWAIQSGEIETPSNGDLLFIPQKPYMTLGSLREQLCYPLDKNRFSDDHLKAVLEEVKLPQIIQRYPDLDIKQDWQRLLSLGEQQRLAFARLLLNSPKYVVLDEATSALDVNTEKHLYELLNKREMACISVGHRPTLKNYHENVLEITENKGWRLLPATSYQFTEN